MVVVVKNSPANAGGIRDAGLSLGRKGSLEEGMATCSSILAQRLPGTEEHACMQARRGNNSKGATPKKHAGRLAMWHAGDRETNCLSGFFPSELAATLCSFSPGPRQASIFTQAQEKNKFHRKAFQSTYQDERALWPGFLFGKIVC